MNEVARSVIFGRDAASYDRYRPEYPPEAIAYINALNDVSTALEIGAGTGKATVDMARQGLSITCLEPSASMAEVLRGRLLPGVEVAVSTFEEWEGVKDSLDLIFAAQAWHWVDAVPGYEKAMHALGPGGSIALMWNVLLDRYDLFEDIYRKHAPQIIEDQDERVRKRDQHVWSDDLTEAGFVDVDRFTHRWEVTLGASEYRNLCATYSDHMLVPEPGRTRLLDSIEQAAVDSGGTVTAEYRTEVFSAKAPDG